MNTNNSSDGLRSELEKLGAREFEIVALSMDPVRGLAAIEYALAKGAERPIPYAIKMFDNEDWQPSGERARRATNLAVERKCSACGGDRFVAVTHDPSMLYGETYAPCAACNADSSTEFWTVDGRKFESAAR